MPGLKQNRDQNGIGSIAKNMHKDKLEIKKYKNKFKMQLKKSNCEVFAIPVTSAFISTIPNQKQPK